MTREYILDQLQKNKEYICKEFSVSKIGLFGSYAKDKANTQSDIDIFVALHEHTFDNVAGLWNYLEDLYKVKVDLFREHKRSKGALYEAIKKETIFI